MILEPGTFRVSEYRKSIPNWVKIVCAIRRWTLGIDFTDDLFKWVQGLRFDHRPALQDRPYDLNAGDFIPTQNDPDYIEAIPDKAHDQRTFGRQHDAERTVTTRGSDLGEAARTRKIRDSEAMHRARMAAKASDPDALAAALGCVKQKTRLRPTRKIPSRGFPKRQRPLRRSA